MSFFANRAFNLVYVHAALRAFAAYGGESFVFVYMLKAGIPAPVVLTAIALMFASRLIWRQMVLPLVLRIGLKRALALSIVAEACTYPVLSQVHDVGFFFFAYLTVWAMASSLYWTTYHGYVSLLGDNHRRGSQVGALEFIGMVVGIIAPGIAAILLTLFGAVVGFGAVAVMLALAAIPIMLAPDLHVAERAEVPPETRRLARRMMFTDGLRSGSSHFTWMIAMFLTLGSSFASYGGAMSLAGLVGAVSGLVIGRSIDLGKGLRALRVGYAVMASISLLRAVAYPLPITAVIANTLGVMAWPIYATAFNSRVYTLARQSSCPLRFNVIAEGGWDMGTCVACLFSAALIQMGFGYHLPLAVSLVGCALGYAVMSRTFRDRPAEPAAVERAAE
jgi:DHA1 family inner membrane transport protein